MIHRAQFLDRSKKHRHEKHRKLSENETNEMDYKGCEDGFEHVFLKYHSWHSPSGCVSVKWALWVSSFHLWWAAPGWHHGFFGQPKPKTHLGSMCLHIFYQHWGLTHKGTKAPVGVLEEFLTTTRNQWVAGWTAFAVARHGTAGMFHNWSIHRWESCNYQLDPSIILHS